MRKITVKKVGGDVANLYEVNSILKLAFDTMANGEYELTLTRKRHKRSINQNNLSWMWYTHIAHEWSDALGYGVTPEQVHQYYTEKFLPVAMPNGRVVGGNTRTLNTEQMTEYLNKVQADAAAEYGIVLPVPEDLMFNEYATMYGIETDK